MARVVVVDDSKVDRHIAEQILGREEGLTVESISGGAAALESIEADPPDLVLTDLVMPGMDGLEIVAAVRERFPAIPVVLMTSQGNEEIAVRALRGGAASYIPKRCLAENLVQTVRDVLELVDRRRTEESLLDTLVKSESEFSLDNRQELVNPMVKHLLGLTGIMGLCDEAERLQVGVALYESLTNAMEHGNLEVSSELRETDLDAHTELLEERRRQPPYCDRRVHVEAKVDRERAWFLVRDEGPGFDPDSLPNPLAPANLDKLSGRGVMLIRSFMDEATFNDRGNQVTMVKRRPAS